MPRSMVVYGEIQTSLVQHSHALSARGATELLSLAPGERVTVSARPMPYTRSPEFLTGLDCRLPAVGKATRAVGTAIGRAIAVGGRIAQGSSFTRIRHGDSDQRPPWSHYLSRPGILETIGKAELPAVVSGVSDTHDTATTLNLAAINERTLNLLRRRPGLDRRPPFRTGHTRLRWVAYADHDGGAPSVSFTIKDSPQRILVLRGFTIDPRALAALCEDIAIHDWLLTSLSDLVERTGIGSRGRDEVIARLQPAIDHLIPLWMPAVRVDPALQAVWPALELNPGFTRQWDNLVQRVRDQFTIAAANHPRFSTMPFRS